MEDYGKSLLSQYEPLDIYSFKKCKIHSEKELEAEAAVICEILKDIKGDWNQRLKSLQQLHSFIVTEEVRSLNNFPSFMVRMVAPLTMQLTDLRSQITKEASKAISLLAQVLQQDFEPLAHRFISKNSLYKLLNSAKHIMAEHSHICIIAILNNVVAPKVIPHIYEEVKSKNPQMRIRNAEYVYLILSLYPEDCYSNYMSQLEELILTLLQDAKSEARQLARMAYLKYKQLFPERCHSIFLQLDAQNQRAILDEEEMFEQDGFQSIRSNENKQKAMLKSLKATHQNSLGSDIEANFNSNSLSLPKGGSIKQARSVSRGRPQTAANNLIQKASVFSPDKVKKLHSPRESNEDLRKESLLEIQKRDSFQNIEVDTFNADPIMQQSPKLDASKLKLLKSPRTIVMQSLKVQTSVKEKHNFGPDSGKIKHRNQHLELQSQQSVEVKNTSAQLEPKHNFNNLGSPKLPHEKQQQLKNLKEKRMKQQEEQPPAQLANATTRTTIKTLQPISSKNIANNAAGALVSPMLRKGNKPLGTIKTTDADRIKRQKSASPTNQQQKEVKQPVKQSSYGTNQPVTQMNHSLKSDKSLTDTTSQLTSQNLHNQNESTISTRSKANPRMQVSHSINTNKQGQKSTRNEDAQIQNQLNSSDEQKIFEELDFLNQNDSIESLMGTCQSTNWNERMRSFQMIKKCDDQLQDCSDQLIKKLFQVHLDYLNDQHEKVIIAVQDSLMSLIQFKRALLDKYLDQIVPSVLQNMVSIYEQVSVSSSDLINVICLYSKSSDLVLIIMDLLKEYKNNLKVITASLEVLVVLLKDDQEYCLKNPNVLETCLKIVELLEGNQNNMDVIMPSIAVLLAMRDKNFEGTMKALVFLKQSQVAIILKLANQFAPDFENDIKRNVINEQLALTKMGSQGSTLSQSTNGLKNPQSSNHNMRKSVDVSHQYKGLTAKAIVHKPFEEDQRSHRNTQVYEAQSATFRNHPQVQDLKTHSIQSLQMNDMDTETLEKVSLSLNQQYSKIDDTFDLQQTPMLKEFSDVDFTQQQNNLKYSEETKTQDFTQSPRKLGRAQSDPQLSPGKIKLTESNMTLDDQQDNDEVEDTLEQFNDTVMNTQQSSKNYLMSKAGDTSDDYLEDGVTPTPCRNIIHQNSKEGAMKGFSFQEETKQLDALKEALQQSDETNRELFITELENLMQINPRPVERYHEEIMMTILDILQEDQEFSIKERTVKSLIQLTKYRPPYVDDIMQLIIESLAIAQQMNKKLQPSIEMMLLTMNQELNKVKLFSQLNEIMSEQDHGQIQMLLKFTGFLLKNQTKEDIDHHFSLLFENFFRMMSHSSANVRKSLVFCMVDVSFIMDKDNFDKYLQKFNVNQQKLVTIYIERRNSHGNGSNE